MMDEEEIIGKIKKGDVNAYALLVEKYHNSLLTFVSRIVEDQDVVEDIGQEVFLSAYRSLKGFDEKNGVPFSAWLFTIARNRCISDIRQKKNLRRVDLAARAPLEDGKKNPEEEVLEREQMNAVVDSLQHIPEPFRRTLVMSLEGCSLDDIAVSQGISMGTVKSRLFRAKERMRLLVSLHFGCKEM